MPVHPSSAWHEIHGCAPTIAAQQSEGVALSVKQCTCQRMQHISTSSLSFLICLHSQPLENVTAQQFREHLPQPCKSDSNTERKAGAGNLTDLR